LAEREEIARQNTSLKSDLAAKGLVFNDVDPAPFREILTKSGFYAEWKSKFGEEAWGLLEESTGKLG
jgi:TRAP-type C4-dicarboxylate transport system substrate-binding protein